MTEFRTFVNELFESLGVPSSSITELSDDELARTFLDKLNKFMYQRDDELGNEYISRFHKFWENYHSDVLGLEIDKEQCLKVAYALEPIYASPDNYPNLQLGPPIEGGHFRQCRS